MVKDLTKPIKSTFLSCEKDYALIIEKLFIENKQWARELKKLLVINTKDCLDNPKYNDIVDKMSVADLVEQGYIRFTPKISLGEHEEVKSYLMIAFDNFLPSDNPQFRDNAVHFNIICHTDYWELGDYRLRPIKIAGYIDGILNNAKLTGIGILNFLTCAQLLLNEEFSGYTLDYVAVHGSDDYIHDEE